MKKTFPKFLLYPFKILFSRFTLALLSISIQVFLIGLFFFVFERYVIYFIGGMGVFSILLVIHIINLNMNSEFKTSWILFILILPTIGGLFYLFCQMEPSVKTLKHRLQARKKENRNYLLQNEDVLRELQKMDESVSLYANYLYHVGHFPVYSANHVKYFSLGELFYEDLLKRLREAKKFIFLEFFIIANDEMWNQILDILKEKVKEGVVVRVLYDGTCSFQLLPNDYPEVLKSFGIDCRVFSPIIPLISTHYNNRDHRKIIVIDGVYAYTGGCNLANEYINQIVRFGHWKDNMILLDGDAVNSFTVLFLEMWNLEDAVEKESYDNYLTKEVIDKKEGFVIPFGDDPFDEEQIGKASYMELLNSAKKTVDIVMPYFILDGDFLNTLLYVSKKGVKVRLILPGIADKKLVNYIAKTFYKDLILSGVEVYEYEKGFTHLKMMIQDDCSAIMGTINLDYRSLYLHFEDGVFLYQVKEILKMKEDYENIIHESKRIGFEELKKISKWHLFLGKIFRIFGPLL